LGDKVENYRAYGDSPYNVLTLHGGPGAVGELKGVSQKIGINYGVIEYLQKQSSIKGLKEEMEKIIKSKMDSPVKIVGFSWGAWLALLFTADYSSLVESLILISSAPFDEKYRNSIQENRLKRMDPEEKELFHKVQDKFKDGKNVRIKLLNKFVELMHKVDAYHFVENNNGSTDFQIKLYRKIWAEASMLRKENFLLKSLEKIECPIKVIHGGYDPHPYQGVIQPMEKLNKEYEAKILKKCGHTPWREKYAEEKFYSTLFDFLKR